MTIQEHIKIERLRALKRMCEEIEENESRDEAQIMKRYGIELLSNLIPIEYPTGKWHECGPMLLACSNCKKVIGAPITNAPAYCEKCGALMIQDEDEEPDEADAELEAWLNG